MATPPHHVARQRWSARVTSRSPRGVGVLGERGLGRFGVLDAHASGCVCGTCTGAPTAGDGEQTSGAWPLLADPPGWDKIQQGKGQVTRETVAGGGDAQRAAPIPDGCSGAMCRTPQRWKRGAASVSF